MKNTDTFTNPIVAGFYPDPSICRVGADYYLVHSTFEYFPGVPVFHGKDLVHWHQIGHCLSRVSQLDLHGVHSSCGIYAPTIRFHAGLFYMVTTKIGIGNFYVTATDPAGPWSEPVWLDPEGMDPSLLFDDDGTVYYTRHAGAINGYIGLAVLDPATGRLDGKVREIWRGTGGNWPEGPHLYKINGKYLLLISEGGTGYEHSATVAMSDTPWGPFTPCPDNPVLSHCAKPAHPIQALGHPDLVETPDGWWMVCLGIRPQGGRFHHLGRETFLTPLNWTDDGWPVIPGRGLELTMTSPNLPQVTWPEPPVRDHFDTPSPGLQWNYLRNPAKENYSFTEKPGWLRLWGSEYTMNDRESPAFIGRRQTHLVCRAATRLAFEPAGDHEEAGLVLRGNDDNHYEIGISRYMGRRRVFFRQYLSGKVTELAGLEIEASSALILSVEATALEYAFFYKTASGARKKLATAFTRELATERIGGFTGVYIGLYATGNGKKCSVPADFDWFDYEGLEK